MAKKKIMHFCTECGFEQINWSGKCPSCNEWNTMKEMKISDEKDNVNSKR